MTIGGKPGVLLALIGVLGVFQAPAPVTLPLSRVRPDAVFEAGGPRGVVSTGDAIWVAVATPAALLRIDPKPAKIAQTVSLAAPPCGGLGEGFGAVWVMLCGSPPGLLRVDAKTNAPGEVWTRGIVSLRGVPVTGVASVWTITDPKGTLARFDPEAAATKTLVAEIDLGLPADAIAFGQGALWIASAARDSLVRVNPHNHVVIEIIKVGNAPIAVAVGEGAIWTLNSGDGTVSRVDPKTNKSAATVTLGVKVTGGQIAAGEGSIWVSTTGAPLVRIDPRTNKAVQIFTGEAGGALAIGHGSLWLAATPKQIWRIDPKLVEATR
jgi:DNA-binding beta-propeller fold protein YncE